MRTERLDDLLDGQIGRERRHAVLQFRQFVGDVGRHQIAPRGQHLAELDEDRPEVFQRLPQPHATRRGDVAPEEEGVDQPADARPVEC